MSDEYSKGISQIQLMIISILLAICIIFGLSFFSENKIVQTYTQLPLESSKTFKADDIDSGQTDDDKTQQVERLIQSALR